jgi:SAM-dependent methyltransferase
MFREVELVDHASEQMDIHLPSGSNKTSTDFDNDAHLVLASAGANGSSRRVAPTLGTRPPARWDNISIVPLKWLSWQGQKSCRVISMPASNATSRFSDRVQNYVRYRPGYPPEVLYTLKQECGLTNAHVIADIASGTGIWTKTLLENGNRVYGVEPNPDMREAGMHLLASFPRFTSVDGQAEATTLPHASVDFITAAQAAHWFDRERARQEFSRIVKPEGWLVLLWNEREVDTTAFLREYEQLLLTYGTDYEVVRHERTTDAVNEFFDPMPYHEQVFPMRQEFDYAGLEGRLLSSSYAPGPNHPKHGPMLHELRRIFDERAVNGRVTFAYQTRVYFGRLK